MKTLSNTSLGYLLGKIKNAFFQKSESIEVEPLGIDSAPTQNSDNLITSGGVYTGLSTKADASALSGYEALSNKVFSLSSASTDAQYPSAKCVYDLVGTVESALQELGGNSPS